MPKTYKADFKTGKAGKILLFKGATEIEGTSTVSFTITRETARNSSLYLYIAMPRTRTYRVVQKYGPSAGIRIRCNDSKQTITLSGWKVVFRRGADYDKVCTELREKGFVDAGGKGDWPRR